LKERGLYENTLILFASDNGLAVGSHGLMGKQSLYEHSMQVPLILSGPGIPRGRSGALVYLMDLYPTVCDLVGAPIPPGLDGESLKPILTRQQRRVRDSLFLAYRDVQRAVRGERWKLIRYPHADVTQLFDLRNDPHELRNLAKEPAQAPRVERMLEKLRAWQQQLGDPVPLSR
jgi:arylsulfatase A-like enzyme